mgnify:CR=1 FL=1
MSQNAIELRNISKYFGSVAANHHVSLQVRKGEILSLLGENGSGKTTLMNMLSGIYYPDEGEIMINGEEVAIRSPRDAFEHGIGMIHQHFKLVDIFTATENIVLGMKEKGRLNLAEASKKIRALCDKYGFKIDPDEKVYNMSVSEKQTVEIIKVLYRGADIEDEEQTVTVIVPEIKTEASTDGKKETTIGGEITIEDIVSYHNLTPGKEYVVKGTLMNKTTGKPVTVNDEPVTAEAAFTPETRDGEVKVAFTFNSYVITETTDVVVFESLYREDVEIAVHADIEDEGQSVKVYVPEIKTTASIDGKKEITTAGKATIEDVVSYTNLIPGTEYTIRGTLMNKATGEVFTVNGETITAEVKFTPKDRNGEVKVTFTFDAHDLTTSTKLVVFESLYREDVEITTHKDIEDKDQTVTITPPPDVPQTGDNSNLGVWIGLGGVALGGAIACIIMYFKKKKDDGEK